MHGRQRRAIEEGLVEAGADHRRFELDGQVVGDAVGEEDQPLAGAVATTVIVLARGAELRRRVFEIPVAVVLEKGIDEELAAPDVGAEHRGRDAVASIAKASPRRFGRVLR